MFLTVAFSFDAQSSLSCVDHIVERFLSLLSKAVKILIRHGLLHGLADLSDLYIIARSIIESVVEKTERTLNDDFSPVDT